MTDFPKMLYRPYEKQAPVDALKLGDKPCQTIVVADEEQQQIAAEDGFNEAAEVLKPKKRGRPRKADVDAG